MKTEKDKPIPDVPVPRENQTGDLKWAEENIYQHEMFVKGFCWFGLSMLAIIILIVGISLLIVYLI